ncbi:predicted protein [Postia placenta Mad-698-R]|uniref:DyP dimeric alpha+beta barrel domain-containing protein n=1 Tax=Postia placenta MAD-698-R-SB12 TaxID=670580 RepID=A0A1X6MKD2_9APHY|nr:hypothetical protein POSPLADRAFT_1159926 [Postia placenta MAD-698-R-SB12]EED79944.1 predicted protein [Postia placenta Mad-698-R]OSX56503.1 hypothetical protein POSPLADRAFT_1159926 [Postia placenta MAD-698-R-SB12]
MSNPDFHYSKLQHIAKRAILPLLPSDPASSQKPDHELPDPKNVQGDIYLLFPKDHENFIFFAIRDVDQFRRDLANYTPTTSDDVLDNLRQITDAKASAASPSQVTRVRFGQTQIAFSRSGLNLLGQTQQTKDTHFDQGSMRNEIKALGDGGPWDPLFASGTIHGVIIVAASPMIVDADECQTATQNVKDAFKQSIYNVSEMDGNTRPGAQRGHEHFGYKDGVSQPAPRGLVKAHTGQLQCDAGVIICGYKGDPVFDNPYLSASEKRPDWTKDGTFMVFRKLEQDVIGFSNYLKSAGPQWRRFLPQDEMNKISPPLTDNEGAELFGARLVGRWKSGAPLATAPYRDDASIPLDEDKVNNFDYTVKGQFGPSDSVCPFTAHTRKTAPRNLDPYLQKQFLESMLVIRAGLPYGPEVAPGEVQKDTSPRGLLFLCYQSSTENGFWQQTRSAVNEYFPTTSLVPVRQGQDPIIGGATYPSFTVTATGSVPSRGEVTINVTDSSGETQSVTGFVNTPNLSAEAIAPKYFVTSRGGEYFFVPSVSILRALAAGGTPGPFTSTPPTQEGVYRIKLYGQTPEQVWEYIPDSVPWVKLCPLDQSNDYQKWRITPLGNGDYYIKSAKTDYGLVHSSYGYWNYGFPIGSAGGSIVWQINERTAGSDNFLKIREKGSNSLDSQSPQVVHFYKDDIVLNCCPDTMPKGNRKSEADVSMAGPSDRSNIRMSRYERNLSAISSNTGILGL